MSSADLSESTSDIPTIAYWRGRPLGEMPREELEREFCNAWREIEQLRIKASECSIAHIRDLAALKHPARRFRS